MSFSAGIVGLPNVGKSTLFKVLTRKEVNIASYPFTTIDPNIGIVTVPDQRLEKIVETVKPEKLTPTIIEFVDIAGLVKGAHRGEGLGNQFLAQIRNCDAILEVIRAFESQDIEHVTGEVEPERDIEIIEFELLMKDLETLEKLSPKLEKEAKKDKKIERKLESLKRIKQAVSQGELISEIDLSDDEKNEIKEYQFLTAKPILYILNIDEKNRNLNLNFAFKHLKMNLKDEVEISELSKSEVEELGVKSQLDELILSCYSILDLITFYTIAGGKEVRAWTLKYGSGVLKAAGLVHSDFERKFIKGEAIGWEKLVEAKSWTKAREMGWLRTVGKSYVVEDGEIIEFKI